MKERGVSDALAILGAGQLGQAVARLVAAAGMPLRLWSRRQGAWDEVARDIPSAEVSQALGDVVHGAPVLLLAVPVSAVRELARQFGAVAQGDQIVLHAIRGVEAGFILPHQIIRGETCLRKIGVLGGPLYAPDLERRRPVAAVVASRFDEVFAAVRQLASGSPVHLHPTHDVIGVEVAGAVAAVSALAAGMCDGLDLGETARGVLLTQGLTEAARLGRALGAQATTFAGLAGVGDLIPRPVTVTARHHRAGALLAAGDPLAAVLAQVEGEVEGVATAQAALERAQHFGLELPLVQAVADVCGGRVKAEAALESVLARDLDLGRGLGLS